MREVTSVYGSLNFERVNSTGEGIVLRSQGGAELSFIEETVAEFDEVARQLVE
jgi:hypothetical protein